MVQFINKAAWQDAELKEEILAEIADGGVTVSVSWDDVEDKPEFGSAAEADSGDFASAAQGALAASAVQPSALGALATLNTVSNAQVAASAAIALNKLANVAAGTDGLSAGTLQATLQALASRIQALEDAAV